MSTQDDDRQGQGVMWAVVIGVVLLAISLAVGMGLYRTGQGALPSSSVPGSGAVSLVPGAGGAAGEGTTPATTADMTTAAADDGPSIRVEDGVVKFYFASGNTELAPGAADALGDVVRGVAAGQTAVISGYHDVTGDPVQNEELAKQRAFAVRDALMALGIGEDKLDLQKPEVTTASGSNAEARRVEVRLQ